MSIHAQGSRAQFHGVDGPYLEVEEGVGDEVAGVAGVGGGGAGEHRVGPRPRGGPRALGGGTRRRPLRSRHPRRARRPRPRRAGEAARPRGGVGASRRRRGGEAASGRRRGGGAAASGEERGRGSRARAREREGIGYLPTGTSILMAHLTLVRHKYIHTNGAPHPGAPLVFFLISARANRLSST